MTLHYCKPMSIEDGRVMTGRQDALDDALERLEGYEYLDLPGPFACHGPMGAEVLSTLA